MRFLWKKCDFRALNGALTVNVIGRKWSNGMALASELSLPFWVCYVMSCFLFLLWNLQCVLSALNFMEDYNFNYLYKFSNNTNNLLIKQFMVQINFFI